MTRYNVPQRCENCNLEAKSPIIKQIGSYMICKYCVERIVTEHLEDKLD